METVVYELEEVEEVVASDVFPLDGLRMSEEEQKNKIFDMLEAKGYDLGDRSQLEIGYEGAEDFDDGMYTTFEVRRKVTREVPYKLKREEVYQGTFFLDGLQMSAEDQREKIFDMMRKDGVEVSNPEELEIGYEGAEDFEDAMFTDFRVFRVTKEKMSEEEITKAEDVSEKNTNDLDELRALREKLNSMEVDVNQADLERIDELTKALEADSSSAEHMTDEFKSELEAIDSQIKELRSKIKETEKSYEEAFKALYAITESQKENLESLGLLSDEELQKLMEENSLEKLLESEKILRLEKELKLEKKQLTSFMRRKNKVERDILKAEALGLNVSEYNEITSTLNKKKIVDAILERKGLAEIVYKKATDRTKEERDLLKSAKEEIEKEIAMIQKSSEGMSVLDAIEALYNIDTEMLVAKRARKVKVKKQDLENMKKNVLLLPEKVVNEGAVMNYVAGKAPEDMVAAMNSSSDESDREEIFRGSLILDNVQRTPEERVRELMRTAGVDVNDDEIEIGYDGVTDNDGLSETQTTPFVVYRKKKEHLPERQEEVIEDDSDRIEYTDDDVMERVVIYNDSDNDKRYAKKYVFDRFHAEQHGEEVRIENRACYELDDEDYAFIVGNANNDYSPYQVEERDVQLGKREEPIVEEPHTEEEIHPEEVMDSEEIRYTDDDVVERVVIYNDSDNDKRYAKKYVFDRFHAEQHGEEVRIENRACYELDDEDYAFIVGNANNDYSPYQVEEREVQLGKKEEPIVEEPQTDEEIHPEEVMNSEEIHYTDDDVVERVVIYNDLDNNKRYAKKYVFDRFHAEQHGEEVRIENRACYELDDEDYAFIVGNANNDYSPYRVEERDVQLGKQEEPIVEEPQTDEEIHYTDDDVVERVVIYNDSDNNKRYAKKYVFDRFHAEQHGEEVRIENRACYELDDEDYRFIVGNANNDYSPYRVEERDIHLGKKEVAVKSDTKSKPTNDDLERIVLYVDLDDNGKRYAKNYVFNRFNAEKQGSGVRINNALCYALADEDAEYIIGNADNDYSPYKVEIVPVHLKKNLSVPVTPVPPVPDPQPEANEVITLFRDLNDNGQIYASEEILRRFGITPSGNPEVIDGFTCYKIDDATDRRINDLARNSNPKIDVKYKNVHLKKKKPVPPVVPVPVPGSVENEVITLFRDLNDNGQIYASEEVLRRFGITPRGSAEVINGLNCYKISREADDLINHIARESKNPKITVKYVDVKLKKKTGSPVYRPHVETILDKLTTDLDIHAKDCKRYQASNIKVASTFKNELNSGNVWYNIVHFVPSLAKVPFMLFRKLSGKLMTTGRARDAMEELERRLDNLSEAELEVLFEEYKGSQLKTDMNNQINGLIIQRLRRYGLEKVAVLNDSIRDSYANLFGLLGQIRAIEEQLGNRQLDANTRGSLNNQRTQLIERASGFVKQILIARKDANNLLSGGVHGLEEDFKAVATRLSYVGMRFGKKNDFDNELQHALGKYGEGLNTAISNGDDEAIVSNFMGLESCYYDNTEIARSVFGNRSVGSKYYSPLAEQFDYRDDPFIRDIFTTVALTSAAVSAVNSFRVHQIESRELLRQQQQEAKNVNSANDTVMDYVHQTGQQIEGHRGTFQEGMEAQAHEDVLSSANMIERAELDMHNWSFGGSYHAADAQGHGFYNQFGDDVTTQINDVATRYGNGAITSSQALQEMANVANGAQSTLGAVSSQCLDILRTYAQSHPQFDLSAVQESMEYIVSHPDAIANMNQGMVDVTNLAGGLAGLSATHVTALSSLPSDMLSTLICAASAAGLALRVSKTMDHKYGRHGYGNEVTDMMDEYLNGSDNDDTLEDEEQATHRR